MSVKIKATGELELMTALPLIWQNDIYSNFGQDSFYKTEKNIFHL